MVSDSNVESVNQNGSGTCRVLPEMDGLFTFGGVVVEPFGPLLL
jgi:hypothetical protein